MKDRVLFLLAILCILGALLSGCAVENHRYEPKEELTLHVQVPWSMGFPYGTMIQQFIQQYAIPFELENPKIRVEVLPGDYEGDKQPDVYISIDLAYGIENQKLEPLDYLMKKDRFDYAKLSQAAAVAESMLREQSPDGQLYGLAGSVNTNVLVYNIDLFKQYGVPLPKDRMTWEQVLELAGRFPPYTETGERLYGLAIITFTHMKMFGPMTLVADAMQVKEIDMTTGKVQIDTPEWRTIWKWFMPLLKNGNLPTEEKNPEYILFREGRAAMWFTNIGMIHSINTSPDDSPTVNWDVVSHPIHPEKPRGFYTISDIAGISSIAKDKQAAWAFLRFYIERKIQQDEVDGRAIKSVYMLEPLREFGAECPCISFDAYDAFVEVVEDQIREVLAGNKTIEEALEYAQVEGQKAVDAQILLDKIGEEKQGETP